MTVESRDRVRVVTTLFPVLFLGAYGLARLFIPGLVPRLIREDGAFEYLQVLLYALAGAGALIVAIRSSDGRVRWLFAVLAAGCAFVVLEEVSWGERLLGFEPPDAIRASNTQDEMSLHNLRPVQGLLHPAYIVVGLAAGLGWLVAARLREHRRSLARTVLPGAETALYFLPVAAFYLYMEIMGLPQTGWLRIQDQEVFETLLAMGFAVFTWVRAGADVRGGSQDQASSPV